MNTEAAKNRFKQIFSDYKQEENYNKRAFLKTEYKAVRTFCLDCDIFTFTELERFEYECLERLNRLESQNQ